MSAVGKPLKLKSRWGSGKPLLEMVEYHGPFFETNWVASMVDRDRFGLRRWISGPAFARHELWLGGVPWLETGRASLADCIPSRASINQGKSKFSTVRANRSLLTKKAPVGTSNGSRALAS